MTLTLDAGQRILFLTDGMPEAPDVRGEPLGYEAFAEMLPPLSSGEPGGGLDGLFARVQGATQETREDDWTALLLEHRRKP
jgi:serine phosphatase RsbU (regulator of sigma subunit)